MVVVVVSGMISSVNSDVRTNLRRRYYQLEFLMSEDTVYFPKASFGPGFFHALSEYVHPSESVSLAMTTGFHSGSIHFQRETRRAFSPDGKVWDIGLSAGKLNSSIEDA